MTLIKLIPEDHIEALEQEQHEKFSKMLDSQADARSKSWEAKEQWLAHRAPDARPQLLAACEKEHQRCRRDRQPIPHYTLLPPGKAIHASVNPG